jgi:hypothetical protein
MARRNREKRDVCTAIETSQAFTDWVNSSDKLLVGTGGVLMGCPLVCALLMCLWLVFR